MDKEWFVIVTLHTPAGEFGYAFMRGPYKRRKALRVSDRLELEHREAHPEIMILRPANG